MNSLVKKILIFASVSVVAVALPIGAYFGTAKPQDSSSSSGETETIPAVVSEMFKDDTPTAAKGLEVTSTKYIQSAYSVTLTDTAVKAFYYDLKSAKGFSGTLEFSIGVKNGVVSYYKFIKNIDEHEMGLDQVSVSKKLFVGYTLGGSTSDIMAGVTTEYTFASMKTAVDAALTDIQGR